MFHLKNVIITSQLSGSKNSLFSVALRNSSRVTNRSLLMSTFQKRDKQIKNTISRYTCIYIQLGLMYFHGKCMKKKPMKINCILRNTSLALQKGKHYSKVLHTFRRKWQLKSSNFQVKLSGGKWRTNSRQDNVALLLNSHCEPFILSMILLQYGTRTPQRLKTPASFHPVSN